MEKLSDRWMYYCGLLATHDVPVDDMKHIQNLIDAEEQGMLVPVVHGEWKYTFLGSKCSVCGYDNENELITRNRYDSPYCPHCGADMRKKVDE